MTDPNESAAYPKAHLNWATFDRDWKFLDGGAKQLQGGAEKGTDVPFAEISKSIEIKEPGYVYIWLSNTSTQVRDVFFDDFKVTHTKSPVVQQEEYYPFGLAFNSYQRENAINQNNLYQGKEKQDELELGIYDFHARMYDPAIARTFQLDPLGEKYYDLSSYSWAANNPLRFIDPTGMTIESQSQDQWDKQKKSITKTRDRLVAKTMRLQEKANNKGWSEQKLASKIGNKIERSQSLNQTLATMSGMEVSTQAYSLSNTTLPDEEGGISLNTSTNVIDIKFKSGSTGNFVHEVTHTGQYEQGQIAFDGNNGAMVGQDIDNEVAAYKAQFAFSPSSVSQLTSNSKANSFGAITPQWVQGLKGGTLYNIGGSANTGGSHLDINSRKVHFMMAYPNRPMDMLSLPDNYTLKTSYRNLYYKQ